MTTTATIPGEASLNPTSSPEASKPKPKAVRVVLPLLLAVALGTGGISYLRSMGKETTDDAQVEGHVASVAPRIAGQVLRVLVTDNQVVSAGQVLVELDDRDQKVKLAAAKADLAAAQAQLAAAETQLTLTQKTAQANLEVAKGGVTQASSVGGVTRAGIEQARADLVGAESRRSLAALELSRSQKLAETGAVSNAELDARRTAMEQAESALAQAKARLVSAEANQANVAGTVVAAKGRLAAAETGPEQVAAAEAQVALMKARVEQAKAAVEQAELNLSYTKVTAQSAGTVSRRSVEPGQLSSPERPMMAIVPLNDTWIVANFKEDQLAHMHPGQRADITVDTFGGRSFSGTVDSLAAGTGSRFSLLPPDNASGNFTKVVQRVPVLIKLAPQDAVVLRPGMSAVATVHVK